jgi:hypothetical protein
MPEGRSNQLEEKDEVQSSLQHAPQQESEIAYAALLQ